MEQTSPSTDSPAEPAIELIDASILGTRSYIDLTVMKDVNWRIDRNDYWVVGAPPGSGKSDLISTMAGLQKPSSGRHFLFGRDSSYLSEDELVRDRLRVGVVFEGGGRLFSKLTVAENVALPICYHRNCVPEGAEEAVRFALELTKLVDHAQARPGSLTRNLHPRVGLARALALQPDILLLDNPLAGVDPRQSSWWIDFLAKLNAGHPRLDGRRVTLVVATDDLRAWLSQGRQFALVQDKKWVPLGNSGQVVASQNPLVRALLATDFAETQMLFKAGGVTPVTGDV